MLKVITATTDTDIAFNNSKHIILLFTKTVVTMKIMMEVVYDIGTDDDYRFGMMLG